MTLNYNIIALQQFLQAGRKKKNQYDAKMKTFKKQPNGAESEF